MEEGILLLEWYVFHKQYDNSTSYVKIERFVTNNTNKCSSFLKITQELKHNFFEFNHRMLFE